jgi:cell division protein FtsB
MPWWGPLILKGMNVPPRPKRSKRVLDTGEDEYELGEREKHWHVSKSVPVAFIITMIVFMLGQTGTAAWFASQMSARVDVLEKAQAILTSTTTPQGERLTRVEEKLEGVKSGITDIKSILTAQDNREMRDRFKSGTMK